MISVIQRVWIQCRIHISVGICLGIPSAFPFPVVHQLGVLSALVKQQQVNSTLAPWSTTLLKSSPLSTNSTLHSDINLIPISFLIMENFVMKISFQSADIALLDGYLKGQYAVQAVTKWSPCRNCVMGLEKSNHSQIHRQIYGCKDWPSMISTL